jgi:hypothetical protein
VHLFILCNNPTITQLSISVGEEKMSDTKKKIQQQLEEKKKILKALKEGKQAAAAPAPAPTPTPVSPLTTPIITCATSHLHIFSSKEQRHTKRFM